MKPLWRWNAEFSECRNKWAAENERSRKTFHCFTTETGGRAHQQHKHKERKAVWVGGGGGGLGGWKDAPCYLLRWHSPTSWNHNKRFQDVGLLTDIRLIFLHPHNESWLSWQFSGGAWSICPLSLCTSHHPFASGPACPELKPHVNPRPCVCRPPGQRDLHVLPAPAGGLHLSELQQQLPVASVSGACHRGFLRTFPVQDVEPGRAAAVCAAEPRAPETGAADQQQPAVPDPPQLSATEIRGLCWWVTNTADGSWLCLLLMSWLPQTNHLHEAGSKHRVLWCKRILKTFLLVLSLTYSHAHTACR